MSIEDALGGMFARTGIDDGLTVSPQTITDRLLRKALTPSDAMTPSRSATALSPTPAITAAPLPRARPASAPPRSPSLDFGVDDEIVPAAAAAAPAASLDFGADDQIVTGQGGIGSDAARVPGQLDPMPPVQPLEDVKPPEPEKPWAFTRGFVSGMMEQNPETTAEALEGLSHLAPEEFAESLRSGSRDLHGISKLSPEAYKRKSGSMWDIKGIDDALTWAGETVGSGLASSVPSLITGTGGAILGGRVGGKVGATVGALGGAAVPSAVMNYGEVYKALKDEKIDPKMAAEYAAYAAGPMAALDAISLGPIVQSLGGIQTVKREVARGLAKRIAQEVAKGAGREGLTETLQEMVKDATVSLAADKPFWTVKNAMGWGESGVAGGLTGAAMGGPAGIRRDQVTPAAPGLPAPAPAVAPAGENQTAPVDIPQAPQPATPPNIASTGAAPVDNAAEIAPENGRVSTPVNPTEDAILRAYGYSPEQIAGMSQREREAELADAKAAGVELATTPEPEISPVNQAANLRTAPISPGPAPLDGEVLPPLRFGEEDAIVGSRGATVPVQSEQDLETAGSLVNREPTEAQKEAGNYRKGHVTYDGLDVTIENPKGSVRSGTSPDGQTWQVEMPSHYGYLKKTTGSDGDQVDVFLNGPPTGNAVVIDQVDVGTGRFDEHKIFLGVSSIEEATALYEQAFSDGKGRERIGSTALVPVADLKTWLKSGRTDRPFGQITQEKRPAIAAPQKLSPLQFLASKGGVQPEPDVRALGFNSRNRVVVPGTGFRPVLRSSGMNSDAALQALVDEGYLPQGASIADAHALMRGEIDAPAQSPTASEPIALPAPAAVEQAFADAGVSPAEIAEIKSLGIVDAAAELVERGMPVEQAIPQATATVAVEGHLTPEQAQEVFGERDTAQSDESVVAGESAVNEGRPASGREDFGQDDERVGTANEGNESASQPAESEGRAEGVRTARVPDAYKYAERSFYAGYKDFLDGKPRKLPSYFTKTKGKNPRNWYSGWDRANLEQPKAESKPTPKTEKWTKIGENRSGRPLYEDEAGVRSYTEGGIRVTEPVMIVPGRGASFNPETRSSDYKLTTELPPQSKKSTADIFDEVMAEEFPAKPARDQKAIDEEIEIRSLRQTAERRKLRPEEAAQLAELESRSVGTAAKSAVKNAVMGLDEVASGLTKLFGGNKLGSGPSFDEDTYRQALPFFKAGVAHFREAAADVTDMVRALIRHLTKAGMDQGAIQKMKPYVVRFIDDIKDGKESLDVVDEPGVHVPASDARSEPEDVSPAEGERDAGPQSEGSSDRGRADVSQPSGNESGPADDGGQARVRGDRPRRDPAVSGRRRDDAGAGGDDRAARRSADGLSGLNHRIEPGTLDEARSFRIKAQDNIRAIELSRQIESEGRPATAAEQRDLAKYVGWGGIKGAFPDADGNFAKGFEEIGAKLKDLLSPEEYTTARRSIQYAHYTAETVVRAMWTAAERLGFKGGQVFEPGMGVGNFAGMMPADVAASTGYVGLELDHVTAGIAKLLYPKWGVRREDFTKAALPADTFDLVIGNPPFADVVIKSDRKYAKLNLFLHDYFFAKSLDAVRPGGVLMFISSAGTMNKLDPTAREYLADRADLVGAIRLPGNAFKENAGTEVTTDIVILRKRLPGEVAGDRSWTETTDVTLPGPDGQPVTGAMSRYFAEHPEMVLGEQGFFDKLYQGRYAVRAAKDADITADLAKAVERLPASVMADWTTDKASTIASDFTPTERKDGSFYLDEKGNLLQVNAGAGEPVRQRGKGVEGGRTAAEIERIKGLIPIRDALRAVYAADLADDADAGKKARSSLNKSYDAFVRKFGPINKAEYQYRRPTSIQEEVARAEAREESRYAGVPFDEGTFDPSDMIARGASTSAVARARKEVREAEQAAGRPWDEGSFDPADMPDIVIEKQPNLEPFMDDQESYRLAAIEDYDKATGRATKRAVFTENILKKERPADIKSVHDGVLHVLNQKGRLDLGEVARLTGKTEPQVIEELGDRIYRLPDSANAWVTSDEYLSGNVRKKLVQAKAAASRDPDFQRNVTALEAAQPVPLGPSQIHATLGMPWIPAETIAAFGRDALGLDSLNVKYVPALAQWFATGDTQSAAAVTTWGTERMRAPVLISNALNRQNPKVFDTIRTADGKTTTELNVAATQAAQDKMEAIKQRFAEWIWNDPDRTDKLAAIYNENYNNLVVRNYDGSYLTTPGVASHWSWRPHQTRVVARIIQSGNTYMAHAVGAGKTSAMIGAGMEMRRLGLVRKPMYSVPNHMLAQFTKEFYEQYPLAKIAVADERRFHTDRRKQFIANVALDDLDAVVITHSAFGKVPISDEFQDGIIKKELDDYRELLSQIPKGQENRVTRSRVEKQIERLEQRLSGRAAGGKKDQVFTFEEMGVDFLFVDEAHLFRKLDFSTKMGTVKGVSPEGSAMSWDLYVKSLYLDSQKPNRSLVLASGTPITNTMAELFTVSRYLQRGELAERGLSQFDAWAGAYGETSAELEQDAAGGYKSVSRFSKFVNVPELSAMVRVSMDIVTSRQLEQYVVRPKLKGGKRIMNLAEKSDALEAYQAGLAARMKAIEQRKGPPKKGDDIMLSVINDGRHAAIDMRLVGESASAEKSKLDLLVDNVFATWERTKSQPLHEAKDGRYEAEPSDHGPATQMIFANLGLTDKRGFSVPNYIRSELAARGVPKAEIAFIKDFKTHVAKQKLFNDMNEGKVRVLIGSTAKMATGVNAQRRLYAIHNLDPLWFPSDDEQRNGRALRQGNMNPEIEINDYSTKGTYDSTMWGMMSRKARFIEGFFNGDATMRDMEDLGEASQYEQAKALTTNDPRLIRLTEMKQQLELARRRESSFKQELYALRARRAQALNDAKSAAARIEDIKQDIAQRKETAGDKFEASIGGQTFSKRTEFGEAAIARIAELKTKDSIGRQIKIAEIGGFPVFAEVRKFMDDVRVDVFIRTNGNHEWAIKDSYSAVGITRSMEAVLGYFETALKNKQAEVDRSQKFLADSLEASKREFDGQAAINQLAADVKQLEADLTPKEPVKDEGAKRDEVPPAQSVQRLTGKAEAKQREIAFAIRMALNQVAGWDVASRAEIVNRITGEWHADWGTVPDGTIIAGMFDYGQDLVTVALAGNPDAVKTAYHEGWHSIEKVLTSRETDLLAREADRLRDFIARYGEYDRGYLGGVADKEVFAEAAAIYARLRSGHQSPNGIHIGVRRAFEKLMELFARLRNALNGLGFTSAEDIFADFNRGEMAGRAVPAEYGVSTVAQQAVPRRGGGSFDPPHETVRAALNDPSLSGRARLSAAIDALMVTPSRALWDRLIDLARFQRAAELAGGQRTRENFDTYLAASLYPGRAGERLRDASHKLFRPLYDAMKARNISRADLHDYLYARHAAERNAQIREIDPNNDAGSGMTDQEAADILRGFEDRQSDFDAVADLADAIVRHNRDLMEREGLESRSTLERWEMAYQHYVPLKGAEASETDQGTPALGKGYDVRRPETRRALGRFDRADDILTNLLDQTQRTIIRAEKNRVGKTFLRWAQQNPSPLYRVGLAEQRRGINPNTGLVETIWVTTSADRESVFGVKIAGETYYIDIRHEGLLTALKQIGVDRLPPFMRMISAFTRQYSAFQTARNPEFVLTNLMRDLADASLNLNAETQAGFRRAFVKNLLNGRALMAAVLGQLDRTDNNLGALYNEWRLAGGKISTFGYKDIDTIRKDVEQELERRTESMAKKIAAQPLRIVNPFTGHVVKLFEAMADVTESMTRLAVYAAAREAGLTQAMAAKAARSITVDFNAKGKYGPQIQALYAFANPAMQGTVNLVRRLARSKRMRYAAGSVAMFGFMMTLWNLGASGEDDEKKTGYEKRPYYEREKNFLIFIPGRKDAVKIPMGYALQPFFMMGENAAMMMMGKTKPLEALTNWLGTTAKAFNPIGGEGSIFAWHFWAGAIAPTITDPIFDLTRNRNWLGRPIHPDEMPWTRGSPRSEQSKTTTSPIAVDVAEWLNRVSGGNHFQKGALDVYPDDLEYAWNFALGGYGKFMLNNYNMSLDKIEGIETPVEKTPFVRRFIASGGSQQIEAQQYYDASKKSTDDVGAMRDALQGMKRGRYPEDAEKTIDELAPKVGYHKGPRGGDRMQSEQIFKESTKQLKALREQERELRRDPNVSRADRARLIEEGRKQQIEIMRDARKAYREMQPTP